MKSLIENLCFELSISDTDADFDYKNTHSIDAFVTTIENDYSDELEKNEDAKSDLILLKDTLAKHKEKKHSLKKEEIKEVYLLLKDRKLHPKGEFDKMGRFYLDDHELVSVRSPSTKYPYSQMKAGRTRKFVEAIADKYNCNNIEELKTRFKSA